MEQGFADERERVVKRYSYFPLPENMDAIGSHPTPSSRPRLTNLKTRVCVLINFTYESVKYFNFLSSDTVGIFNCLMNNNFFNERIEHFGSQFSRVSVLLD